MLFINPFPVPFLEIEGKILSGTESYRDLLMRRQNHENLLSEPLHQHQQFQQDVREGSRGAAKKPRGEV